MCRGLYLLICLAVVLGATLDAGAALVAHWRLDEGTGTTAYDATGNGYDGTIMGNPTWVAGVFKGALSLDGNGDYINLGNPPDWPAGRSPRSLCGWGLTNTVATGYRWFAAYGTAGTSQACFIGMNGTRAIGGGYNADDVEMADFWTVGEWHHLALTYDGTTARLYADAVEIASAAKNWDLVLNRAYIGEQVNGAGELWNGIIDEVCVFDQALTPAEIADVMAGMNVELADDPSPEDEAVDVPREVELSWTPGEFAATHDVYFGTAFDDVNAASRANPMGVLVSQAQSATTYDPIGRLDFETTYYWRVDEVNAAPDNTIFKGEVWSFTSEPFAYAVPNVAATSNGVSEGGAGPENTVNGSGLNTNDQHSTDSTDMWLAMPGAEPLWIQYEFDRVYQLHQMLVWNYNVQFELMLGFGVKGATVEYSVDGADWTVLGDVELARATAKTTYTYNTTVDFGSVPVKYVRLNVSSGFGMMGQFGLSEVRFMFIPSHARQPEPADGATDVDPGMPLGWRAGRQAASHEVYLGTDPAALSLAGTATDSAFTPDDLVYAGTYYWRVDEVNEAEAISRWEGDVWSFATAAYGIVDDMESYTDDLDTGTTIFDTWIDGWVNGSGSTVGYFDAPFAERTIVHGGGQSMPLGYDNTVSPNYSEAVRTFDSPQDWTGHGVQSLGLYFRGTAGNGGQLYVKIDGTKVVYDGDAADIGRALWQPWNIDLSAVGNLSQVTELAIGVDGPAATGMLYIDDIRLYPNAVEYITPSEPTAGLVARYALDGNADDSSGNGYNGTAMGAPTYVTGVQGQAVQLDGVDQYIDFGNPAGWPSGTASRSMAAWGKPSAVYAGWRFMAAYGNDATGQAMFIGMNGPDLYGGGYGDDIGVAGFWVLDEWRHVALTYDGATATLYADGIEVISAARNWNLVPDRAHIGRQVNDLAEFWAGAVDEVRLYDRALSADEIAWLAGRTTPMHKSF